MASRKPKTSDEVSVPTVSQFKNSISDAERLLKRAGLRYFRNPMPAQGPEIIEASRSAADYPELCRRYLELNAYDLFILDDGSLFRFWREPSGGSSISLEYLQSPLDFRGVMDELGGDELEAWERREVVESYADLAPQRETFTPIRFDWAPDHYREGGHPAAHMHVGFRSDVRISIGYVLQPHSFVAHILRYFYLGQWESRVVGTAALRALLSRVRSFPVKESFFGPKDAFELCLK